MALIFLSRALCRTPASTCSYRNLFSRLSCRTFRSLSQTAGVSVQQGKDSVEIRWNLNEDVRSKYHYIWLRDNCRCPECYHPETHQRLVDVLELSTDLRPNWVELGSESVGTEKSSATLTVEWEDGHRSEFPLLWLQSHSYESQGGKPRFEAPLGGRVGPTLWGKEISEAPPVVTYERFMKDDQTYLEWSDNVDQYGFCFIDGVPLDTQYSKQVLERIGVLRHTFYGDFWDFEANSEANFELDHG